MDPTFPPLPPPPYSGSSMSSGGFGSAEFAATPSTSGGWASLFSSLCSRVLGFSFFASLLSHAHVLDSLKLVVLGSLIEAGRRLCQWLFERFRFQYSITAQFHEGDPAYDWIVLFLTAEDVWRRAKDFHVSAKSSQRRWGVATTFATTSATAATATSARTSDTIDTTKGSERKGGHAEYVPTYGLPQLFRWNGFWVETKRNKAGGGGGGMYGYPQPEMGPLGSIFITIYTLDMKVLESLVEAARQRYLEVSRPHVIIHTADMAHFGPAFCWNNVKRKTRRPLQSIVLEEGVIESILRDAREFIAMEDWYVDAGIPHRRGYLLHGPPGTGKSSTIYALAGELGMEIYSLSLAAGFVDDSFLQRAASSIPKNSIFLIEDIDCAFPSREETESAPYTPLMLSGYPKSGMGMVSPPPPVTMAPSRRSAVTLSGLLNVLDGVGSEEGKLFFATTNYIDHLDAALLRPGRIDVKIQYNLATKKQASALFARFYPPAHINPPLGPVDSAEDPRDTEPDPQLPLPSPPPIPPSPPPPSSPSSLSEKESLQARLDQLANSFAERVPVHEFSTAELQGYLLGCKKEPEKAVRGVSAWVERERAQREERRRREEARSRRAVKELNFQIMRQESQMRQEGQMRQESQLAWAVNNAAAGTTTAATAVADTMRPAQNALGMDFAPGPTTGRTEEVLHGHGGPTGPSTTLPS